MHSIDVTALAWLNKAAALLSALGWVLYFPGLALAGGDCWLEIYDKSEFQGKHVRIQGPAQLPNLRQVDGEDWGSRIDSLIVGPKAQVLAFVLEDFKDDAPAQAYHGDALRNWKEEASSYSDKEITFGPGHKEHHMGELSFHRDINSLKITCVP